MTLLIYYTILYYHGAPLWMWLLGAGIWVLHVSWHYNWHMITHRKLGDPVKPPRIHVPPYNLNEFDAQKEVRH